MARSGARNSAADHSFMDKLYKPVVSYAKNVGTQVAQAGAATAKSLASAYSPKTLGSLKGSAADAAAKAASAKARKQAGQAIGAITQNRKYKD